MHGQPVEAAKVHAGRSSSGFGIQLQNENLPLAIEHRLGGEQDVGPEDSVDCRLMHQTGGATGAFEIDDDHWFIDQVQSAKLQTARDRHIIEGAVDAKTRWELGARGNSGKPKMRSAMQIDRANRGTRVNAKPGRLIVYVGLDEQMILLRTNQW